MADATTQKTLVLNARDNPLSLQHAPIPAAVPGSAVVKILATVIPPMTRGVLTGQIPYPLSVPLTPGSTAVGRIHDLGPDATTLSKDQLVYIDVTVRSRDDPTASILLGWVGGFDPSSAKLMDGEWRNGTLAEFTKVPLENVYRLDEDLLCKKIGYSFADLNALGPCLVPAGGLMQIDVQAGETVIVAPATGFFSGAAVHMALGMGAKVIAVGRNAAALAKLTETYASTERFTTIQLTGDIEKDTNVLKTSAGGKGADAYIDFSPPAAAKSPHLPICIQALRPFGRMALMGGVFANVEFPYIFIMLNSIRVQGRYMFDRDQCKRVIQLVESRMMKFGPGEGQGICTQSFKLEQIEEAMDVAKRSGWGRLVVIEP